MLTKNELELIWNIEVGCRRCIRAAEYCAAVTGRHTNLWKFTQNCYGEVCVIHWCKIFGSKSEPTHYSKLFQGKKVVTVSREQVKDRLRSSIGMSDTQYEVLWKGVKQCRDKFFAHKEFGENDAAKFPDLTQLANMCLEMRNILRDVISAEESEDQEYQENIRSFVEHMTNKVFSAKLKPDVARLYDLINTNQGRQGAGINS